MSDYEISREALIRQILLSLCSSLGCFSVGMNRGFTSPGIPSMKEESPHLVTDPEAISWFISVAPLGAALGGVVAMPWMHYFGRKRVLQIIGPIFGLSWMGMALSQSFSVLMVCRIFCGICAGISFPAAQVYVCECSHPRLRGLLAALPSVMLTLGTVVQFFFGIFLDWRGMAWVSAAFPASLAVVLIPFPDSPPWLKLKGKKNYEEACYWLSIRHNLESSQIQENETLDDMEENHSSKSHSVSLQTPFFSRGIFLPLFLAICIVIFQQTCGNDVIIYNTVEIFRSSGFSLNSYVASLIVAIVHLVFVFLSIFLIDKFGRKFLLILSALVMGISMSSLSGYFFLQDIGKTSNISFLPLISLMVFIAAFSIGFLPVPYILFGEIFPSAYRSYLGPLTHLVALGAMFIELKTYPYLINLFDKGGTFALYSFMNFFAAAFVYFLLPETKRKSLDEIESFFIKKHNTRKMYRLDES